SIASVGVLVPLLVKQHPSKDGVYLVHGGGRRLDAVHSLVKDKTFHEDYPVPCRVLAQDMDPIEAGLVENLVRADMHPIDEFEAFSALHQTNKVSIADIAARFGKTQLEVRKRLALGNAHPELRLLCRAGKIDLDALMAYAGTDD